MREIIDVVVLAVLQGIAEFLPVSSSGHLVVAQHLLHLDTPSMRLAVILHLGTMLSILAFYRKRLLALTLGALRGDRSSWATAAHIVVSAIPAAFFYFLCHDKVDAFYEDPRAVGGFLMFTGVVLCALRWMHCGDGPVTGARALLVGIAQALAVIPGVSRSGMTIAAARMAGIAPDTAAEFSFLMCLPLLAGGALLDLLGATAQPAGAAALPGWLLPAGAAISAAVGYAALALLVRTLRSGRFWLFGVYCLLAGAATLLAL
ncbi:MAG: undecaprenyl-diphosphate phosphatase [Verrucomicrobiota bacterium]|jgi:undecaprenyl-diphosphatase|nr:undecaprenyl-diphosphate phosphatase [Verrucomicrobiota bacterium]